MIGQEKLINQIDKLTLNTFPHSTMLVGDLGSGKQWKDFKHKSNTVQL